MALFAIPNPQKSTQVDFPIERVKLSVQNISLINNKYKFTSSNEIFNQYTFEALELLSLGVFIDINLNSLGENKTEITVEIRRKIGSFNQSYEVTRANEHLVKIFDCIAKLTMKSPEEIEELKNATIVTKSITPKPVNSTISGQNLQSNAWYEKSWLAILLCIIFFPVGLYALWKNSTIKKGWKIAITVIIALIVIANIGDSGKSNSKSTSSSTTSNSDSTTQTNSSNEADKTKEKEWQEVFKFKGNGLKKSSSFALSGVKTRIKYKFSADIGMFSIYVVPEGQDIMKEGGIPEVMTQQSETSETYITKDAGNYYLHVNSSGGNWTITVEEEK